MCKRIKCVCGGLALEKEEVASLFSSSRKTTGHRHRPDVYPVHGLEHGLHPHHLCAALTHMKASIHTYKI